jgi:hypothetical protein
LSHVELVHLVLQRAQGNSKVLGRCRHVPAALLERAQDEVPLERVGRVLEQAVGATPLRLELGEVELERQVFFEM